MKKKDWRAKGGIHDYFCAVYWIEWETAGVEDVDVDVDATVDNNMGVGDDAARATEREKVLFLYGMIAAYSRIRDCEMFEKK